MMVPGPPPRLPDIRSGQLLVRTDYGDDSAWSRLTAAAAERSEEGFRASITIVDEPAYNGLSGGQLCSLLPTSILPPLLFIADRQSMTAHDPTVLAFPVAANFDDNDLEAADRRPFRVVVTQLRSVENNLSIANMDWADFVDALDADGVFRAFPPPPRLVHTEQVQRALSAILAIAAQVEQSGRGIRVQPGVPEAGGITTGLVRARTVIAATRSTIYRFVDQLDAWLGLGGIPDFRVGGGFTIRLLSYYGASDRSAGINMGATGSVTHREKDRRLSFTLDYRTENATVAAGTVTVDLLPTSVDGSTEVVVEQHSIPTSIREPVEQLWTYYLEYLDARATDQNPMMHPWWGGFSP